MFLQTFWRLVDVVNLVDRHASVRQVQHLIVQVRIHVALSAHHLGDPLLSPTRPAMRCEHHLRLIPKPVQRDVDVLRPRQCITHRCSPQREDVVQAADDVLRGPECLEVRKPGVHLRRRFSARSVLENHPHAVDGQFLHRLLDAPGRGQDADVAAGSRLANRLHRPDRKG